MAKKVTSRAAVQGSRGIGWNRAKKLDRTIKGKVSIDPAQVKEKMGIGNTRFAARAALKQMGLGRRTGITSNVPNARSLGHHRRMTVLKLSQMAAG